MGGDRSRLLTSLEIQLSEVRTLVNTIITDMQVSIDNTIRYPYGDYHSEQVSGKIENLQRIKEHLDQIEEYLILINE